ncbi:hypothetical protein CKAH01_09859 [Colletotrichum kahawae]|uniref:Uncharacterized protein n=1 Tax=Colletotrichum kahawae TaxID=34407 RepID=A0AAE0CYB5_COLKA|nr:hypothetical protein CKAH01_09859 [Colletotrichum kahawae]
MRVFFRRRHRALALSQPPSSVQSTTPPPPLISDQFLLSSCQLDTERHSRDAALGASQYARGLHGSASTRQTRMKLQRLPEVSLAP